MKSGAKDLTVAFVPLTVEPHNPRLVTVRHNPNSRHGAASFAPAICAAKSCNPFLIANAWLPPVMDL